MADVPRFAVGDLFGSSHKKRIRSGQSGSDVPKGGEMNLQLMFEIGKLALSVVDTHLEGKDQDVSVETRLLQIIRAGVQAYQQHTGEPGSCSDQGRGAVINPDAVGAFLSGRTHRFGSSGAHHLQALG